MHELSLAEEICRIAERAAGATRAHRIREVAVEVGEDAGVESDALGYWLEVLLQDPPFHHAAVRMIRGAGDMLRVRHLEVDDDDQDD
jgi:Zn finger protein HypA/HybF involved in hydrogenase expression